MDTVFEAAEAQAYERWLETPTGKTYVRDSCALLDRTLDLHPGWRVLDVGCGLGVHLAHLMSRGALAYGLEAGPVAARLAAGRLGPKADIEVGDAHELPYEDNSFDAVILVDTLQFTERRAQVVAEAARVATSRVCLVAMNLLAPRTWMAHLPGAGHPFASGRLLPPGPCFAWCARSWGRFPGLGPERLPGGAPTCATGPWAATGPCARQSPLVIAPAPSGSPAPREPPLPGRWPATAESACCIA